MQPDSHVQLDSWLPEVKFPSKQKQILLIACHSVAESTVGVGWIPGKVGGELQTRVQELDITVAAVGLQKYVAGFAEK